MWIEEKPMMVESTTLVLNRNSVPYAKPEERTAKVVNQHKLSGKIKIILGDTDAGECGNCGKPVLKSINRYCHECGYRLIWGDDHE